MFITIVIIIIIIIILIIIIIDWAKQFVSDCHSYFFLYSHFHFSVFGLQEGK